ncbi:hypothetical protein GCM10010345_21850 [Streptomyces canarius]|uniref:Uncharacterized protein n=1 Tax=Streptomyces canarius TaxID=285453 RepID=A0ABQ3CIR5_9ACTN|nr:hypothetical protein GCM10010345_21850 [Streptomyces canarius]
MGVEVGDGQGRPRGALRGWSGAWDGLRTASGEADGAGTDTPCRAGRTGDGGRPYGPVRGRAVARGTAATATPTPDRVR